ncbi:MAG: RES family NAD+ phosphorylase [Longimicrobiales bacterium]
MISPALWRAFPWAPLARPGAPFSPEYRPRASGAGRFDLPLPGDATALYLAETPEHAVGELLQDLRNQTLDDDDLVVAGYRLTLALLHLRASIAADIPDLCDAATLVDRAIPPDELAYRDRGVTQAIAARLRGSGAAGFRWWSAIAGEWHSVVLFSDRLPAGAVRASRPQPLTTDHAAVRDACEMLGIRIVG